MFVVVLLGWEKEIIPESKKVSWNPASCYYTISEKSCRITGFYEMRFRTAQTKSLCYKREVYN